MALSLFSSFETSAKGQKDELDKSQNNQVENKIENKDSMTREEAQEISNRETLKQASYKQKEQNQSKNQMNNKIENSYPMSRDEAQEVSNQKTIEQNNYK